MDFTVNINMDNAAFDEPDEELARILKELASKLESSGIWADGIALRDINGNKVGNAEVKEA
jgi:hypothetical protein